MSTTRDPWLWLVQEGHRVLKDVQLLSTKPLRIDGRRHRLDAVQQAMLEEQLRFRQRSRDRFPDGEKWLWTDRSLQQASDWSCANYKASLIAPGLPVVDACCGAGADLVAFAQTHRVLGVDRDPRMARLAQANLRAHDRQGSLCVAEIPESLGNLSDVAVHIDPDRRVGEERSTRTTHGEAFSPSLTVCMQLAERARAAIIKLAPATEVLNPGGSNLNATDAEVPYSKFNDSQHASDWRRCWLGTQRECPQQLLLRGDLALRIPSGQVAAVLCRRDRPAEVYCGDQDVLTDTLFEPQQYVYEPHPALYAAGLAPAWAAERELCAVTHPRGYYTGERLEITPWSQTFRVLGLISWDDRRLRKWLRAHGAGTLEVKSRLVTIDASQLQRKYSQPEGRPLVCLITRSGKGLRAIMAERTSE